MQSSSSGEVEIANASAAQLDSGRESSQERSQDGESSSSSSSSNGDGSQERNSFSPSVCSEQIISGSKSHTFDYNQYLNQENKENNNPLSNYIANQSNGSKHTSFVYMNQNLSRENQNDSFTRGLTDVLPQSAKQSGNSKAIAGAMRAL